MTDFLPPYLMSSPRIEGKRFVPRVGCSMWSRAVAISQACQRHVHNKPHHWLHSGTSDERLGAAVLTGKFGIVCVKLTENIVLKLQTRGSLLHTRTCTYAKSSFRPTQTAHCAKRTTTNDSNASSGITTGDREMSSSRRFVTPSSRLIRNEKRE